MDGMHVVQYQLPCALGKVCQDRFDICNSTEDEVPFWELFTHLILAPVNTIDSLIDVLETIAISLCGTAGSDYKILRETLSQYWDQQTMDFFVDIWPVLRRLALELPILFVSQRLDCLTLENNRIVLSRCQVACLVVHQFLCTLPIPQWMTDGSPDFHIWYSSATPHPQAVRAYLFSLFHYFQLLAQCSEASPLKQDLDGWPIVLHLQSGGTGCLKPETTQTARRLVPLEIVDIAQLSSQQDEGRLMGLPNGASVIFANKDVGFGQTASQEEMIIGCSPELCIVVLFQPTLRDEEVLFVEGAQAMISMKGHGRDAQFHRYLEQNYDLTNWRQSLWRKRTVLFMDALEFDDYDSTALVPDVIPGNVDRELKKAYTAFSSLVADPAEGLRPVVTGLWGCGSFGGNAEIKTLIQWAAASMANVRLLFAYPRSETGIFAKNLEGLLNRTLESHVTVDQVLNPLRSLQPYDMDAKAAFLFLQSRLVEDSR